MFAWKVELYTRLHGFKYEFSKFSGEGLPMGSPSLSRSISGFAFDSGFDLKSRALRALGLGFTLNSLPIYMFDHFPKQGKLKIIYFTPLPQLLGNATVFYNSIYRFSYVTGRPDGPGPPPIFQTSRRLWDDLIKKLVMALLFRHTATSR